MTARSLLIRQLCCIACELEGVEQLTPTEAHHCNLGGLAGQKRRGDEYQLPLCAYHHRGDPPPGMSAGEALYHYGPSLARSSKRFRECYGDDQRLLELVEKKLAVTS